MSETDQTKAKASMEALRQEIRIFPEFDYKTALNAPVFQNPVRQAVSQFFANAPDFDFRSSNIDTYLAEHSQTAFKDIDPRYIGDIYTPMRRFRRVLQIFPESIFQVIPELRAMTILMDAGFDSAHSIASLSPSAFVEQIQDGLGSETQARMVYAKAKQIDALTMNTFVHIRQHLNDVSPMVIGSVDQPTLDIIKTIPDWATLFGSLELCDCEECRSVYSPAAYFVDLLQFLNPMQQPKVGRKPIDALLERRPDLQFIKLTCENTNTPLPYVDLVNEILETYVALDGTTVDLSDEKTLGQMVVKDTSPDATADELSANPAYINEKAYDKLKQVVYPFTLPYNRPLEIVRTYLEQLGSSRYEVMKIFQKNDNITFTLNPSDTEIAYEYLKISPEEHDILLNGPLFSTRSLWEFYGYTKNYFIVNVSPPPPAGGPSDLGGVGIEPIFKRESWEEYIAHVPEFLQQTGLSYPDLIELVQTRFLKITRETREGYDPCDLNNVTIKNLDDPTLKKLHRFIRLQRKIGWTIRDLDRVLYALGATDIDDPVLQKLALVKQLQEELNIPLVQLLSLWADIDADGDDALYNMLFKNKAVLNPFDPDFALVQTQGKWELSIAASKDPNAKISTHISTILAALRITAADLNALTATEVTDDALNLCNLSMLYSFIVLARALRSFISNFTVKDLIALKALTGKNPFLPGDPTSTQVFVDIVNKVSQSGFSVAQLNYLYRHLYEPNRGIAPLQKNIDLLIKGLQDGLKKIASDNVVVPDPTGDLLRRKLSIILPDSKLVDTAMKVIDGPTVSQVGPATGSKTDPAMFIDTNFGSFLDTTDAKTKLLAGSTLSKEDRYAYVLAPLMDYLRVSLSQNLVKQTIGDTLKLDTAMADLLLNSLIKSRIDATRNAMADFLGGVSATYFSNKNLQPIGTTVKRIDSDINFNWPTGSPDSTISGSTFSARWTGKVLALYSETYTFFARTTNGVRLWINDQLLIDDWNDQPVTEHSASLDLKAGQLYDLRMEYYSSGSNAVAELRWSSTSTIKTLIPPGQLYPNSTSEAFQLLYKAAMLINTFGMTVQEVTYLSSPVAVFAGFDFNALPLDATGFTTTLFDQWEQLADYFAIRNSLPKGEVGLIDVFGTTTLDDLNKKLYAATNWDPEMLKAVSSADGFGLDKVDSFKSIATLMKLQACLNVSKRLGVSIQQLFSWATDQSDTSKAESQAQEIKNVVKAKYDNDQWLTVAKTLNDGLRESQKAALIAYLLQTPKKTPNPMMENIKTSSQLYEYFLIDVDMSACMMTSRIVQAISTVQLFVQRCLMNLETEVSPATIDADEWKWMKRYRVWEANRKVFLYPENWIEPELRDNKSPFFKELETELLQSDITLDTAEQAFLNYMEKLDQVSRLEICGMYWQEESNDNIDWRDLDSPDFKAREEINILHVFARTFAVPHIYYYRKLINGTTWTPWEKVNVDIEGDHLIPVVWNRRLHIFWPVFVEKADPDNQSLTSKPSKPNKYLEMKFAWSEYKQGKWSPKQVSVGYTTSYLTLTREDHVFRTDINNGTLTIYDVQKLFEPSSVPGDPPVVDDRYMGEAYFTFTGCNGRIKADGTYYWNTPSSLAGLVVASSLANPVGFDIPVDPGGGGPGGPSGGGPGGPPPPPPPPPPHKNSDPVIGIASPETSYPKFMEYVGDPGKVLKMLTGDLKRIDFSALDRITLDQYKIEIPTLDRIPTPYHILGPHQFQQFALQAPFFYQDDSRTYFVTPTYSSDPQEQLRWSSKVIIPFNRALAAKDVTNIFPYRGEPSIFQPMETLTSTGASKVAVTNQAALSLAGGLKRTASNDATHTSLNQPASLMVQPKAGLELLSSGRVNSSLVLSAPALKDSLPAARTYAISSAVYPQSNYEQTAMHFATYFHPHICEFIRALNRDGVQYLLTLANQQLTDSADPSQQPTFHGQYSPVNQHVLTPYPLEDVDFDYCGAYSLYNWELFFHIPMLIATKLSKNQRFEEAQQWFHYIFNPTDFSSDGTSDSSPRHYWRVLPFNRNTENERIQDLLKQLNGTSDNGTSNSDCKHDINVQIEEWRHNPFNPHLIARMRLIAYQKSVVMKYIDNLIAWGDQLFQQDSMESINEATQLYILAYEMLGPLPEQIPAQGTIKPVAYADVPWDSFSNAQVSLENYIQADGSQSSTSINGSNSGSSSGSSLGSTFYFCIPKNDKLLGYWNTVADRLFKIRHCMNIEGVVRQLPLFAPPIDPALLVQAAAMGVDLTSALNDINAATPHYRFTYILPKALELCGELRAFGGALLSALEKKDAEAIAALRASQETNMLKAARLVKEQQLEEAKTTLDGLKKTRQVTEIRYNFYNTIQFMNDWETTHLVLVGVGAILQAIEGVIESASSGAHLIPDVTVGVSGWAGTPVTTVKYGGSNSGGALQGFARALGVLAALANTAGSMSATMGGYQRRADEWQLQVNLASKELEQIDKQIAAADIRTAIAQKELDNHDKQIENAAAIEDFLRDKYTNQDLYDWMVGQISAVYFQCYKMAYDIAKRVEQAFRFERGLSSSDFITFGYWDSLKKGLLAGEQLYLDLKRLDMAYLDQNKREYEITKHISLVFFDPMALITLKETGTCIVDLPEALFDMDYPGHYMRRIKSVSLTIPCVTGPYTSINCTLTLQKNTIRKNSNLNLASDPKDPYSGPKDDDDALSRFITTFGAIESIATSTAQNDSGMFEVNFRDERYLPFEGAGVVSTWRIDMPQDCNSFDFETISDVIMKLNYTAREGGTQLGNLAKAAAQLPPITPQKMRLSQQNTVFPNQDNLQRLFSAKHEFPSDWYRLLHLTDSTKSQQMTLDLTQERFPFQYRNKNITINKLTLFLDLKDGATYDEGKQFAFDLNHKDNAIASGQHFTAQGSPVPNLPFVSIPSDQQALNEPVNQDTWSLANVVNAKPDIINDLWIVCQFTVSNKNGSY